MTDRDRLIELLNKAHTEGCFADDSVADYLLANDVIVPPCKVGDKVYFIQGKKVYEGTVILIRPFIHRDNTTFHGNVVYECIDPFYNDGRTMEHQISVVFEEYGENTIAYLTKEEAEQKLQKLVTDTNVGSKKEREG